MNSITKWEQESVFWRNCGLRPGWALHQIFCLLSFSFWHSRTALILIFTYGIIFPLLANKTHFHLALPQCCRQSNPLELVTQSIRSLEVVIKCLSMKKDK